MIYRLCNATSCTHTICTVSFYWVLYEVTRQVHDNIEDEQGCWVFFLDCLLPRNNLRMPRSLEKHTLHLADQTDRGLNQDVAEETNLSCGAPALL